MRFGLVLLLVLSLFGCVKNQKKHQLGKPWTEIEGNSELGVEKKYSAEGVLVEETPFVKGIPQGLKKVYYSNGNLRKVTPCDSGIVNGVVKEFYKSGKLYKETPFIKGRLEGTIKKYYEDGKTMSEAPYKKNEAQLGLIEYDKNGKRIPNPKILIKGRDKIILDGTYIIELTLSNNASRVTFGLVLDGGTTEYISPIVSEKGTGIYKEYIPYGDIVMKTLVFEAKFKTKYGNICKVREKYTLAISSK